MDHRDSFVGRLWPRFDGVRSIAVLRGGGLGDVLFAVPALEALAAAYPDARITLLGTPLHAQLFEGRPGPVAEVAVLPHAEGVRRGPVDPRELDAFVAAIRERRFDLGVQVHGGGRFSNPFLLSLGADHTVGTGTPDAARLERTLPYLYYQHEVLRALEVAGLAGAAPVTLAPRLEVTEADRDEAASVLGEETGRPLLVLHPGATDARRHWPVDRFATIARWAADDGIDVVVVGDESERDLAAEVVRLAGDDDLARAAAAGRREPAGAWGADRGRDLTAARPLSDGPGRIRSVAGRLSLSGLVGVLDAADVVVANDSGPRHLAEAVGAATVGIYWIGNAMMASPLARARHRIHIGWATHCPVCGHDITLLDGPPDCGHVFCLTESVRAQDVYADALALLELAGAGEA
ncbi:MAG TPA: glycosyltransferase family 9 protein [Propionibacteriaceae bacterium]|nr:glycosyltransferase family 9 protein [Propionibacteriaceae bacterium]